jgi:hypothetical protein
VQLIGTAHGRTLDNLLLNPTLCDLVGGIESVTLSDEEARRRGTQKTVLERRAPPTFTLLIEIQDRQQLAIHSNVTEAVDSLLRGRELAPELRYRNEDGEIEIERGRLLFPQAERKGASRVRQERRAAGSRPVRVYSYGVARNRLVQAAKRLHVPIQIVDDLGTAETLVTLKSYYRRRPRAIVDAERRNLPVFVLRANTVAQMENFLIDWFRLDVETDPAERALREAESAIHRVLGGAARVNLAPQPASLRRKQHELARQHSLTSRSHGKEPRRRVRIYRD